MMLLAQGWETQLQSPHLLSFPQRNASVQAPLPSDVDREDDFCQTLPLVGRDGACGGDTPDIPAHPDAAVL